MIYIVLGLLGTITGGAYLVGRGGVILGALTGLLLAAVIELRKRLQIHEQRLAAMERRLAEELSNRPATSSATDGAPDPASTVADTMDQDSAAIVPMDGIDAIDAASCPKAVADAGDDLVSLELELDDGAVAGSEPSAPKEATESMPGRSNDPMDRVRAWLFGGNLVVRIGVVVLLFGFAFLVKYAAARNLVPLEVRLTAVFAAGIGMLLLGWRLRRRRMGYAVTLQGGGIGIMYLTLFAAARLFHLVPIPLTLVVMIGLVVFSGLLAVLQDAAAMGVLGAAGGFLAPVLLSTGTGSHVMLFSYYALLNAGIFGIAWFKSWRWLNLLGFGFTFGIGSAWGVQYYRPDFLATTEPFLILFFAFYLTISVLFALRQPPRLKGYVDGTLVFGLPLVVFGLQAGLIKTVPYGLAFSALAMGLVYIGLATLLWRRDTALRALVEAFLALGVIFGSLAVPLALSGSWTAVTWSLEGAALVWIGLRQHRRPARWFGLLLQIASGVLFLMGSDGQWRAMAVINNHFMGGMMVGTAGLFSAYLLERYSARLHQLEQRFGVAMLVWGLLWWFGTGLNEIDRLLSRRHEWPAALTFIGASALFMGLFYRRLNWQAMRWPAMGLVPVMILAGAAIVDDSIVRHPLQGAWAAVWPAVFLVHALLMRWMDAAWPERAAVAWHAAGGILAIGLLSWEAGWLLDRLAGGAPVWSFVAWGSVPAIAAQGVVRLGRRIAWPSDGWRRAYLGWLPLSLMLWMMVWTTLSLTMDGDPLPLPYLPLMNPLDLSQAAVLLVAFGWLMRVRQEPVAPVMELPPSLLWSPPLIGVFLWLTAVVARTVHHFADVPYDWSQMLQSNLFHAAVSILWGVLALSCTVTSSRWQHRRLWFAGAGLLGIVVVKLFLVDLSGSGTISRIVSFLFVGALMLVIGFFSPLPPAEPKGSGA